MKNYVQPGEILTLTAPTGGVVSGNAYLVGAVLGIAVADAAAGSNFESTTTGVFNLPVDAVDTPTEGQAAYWDNANAQFTVESVGNVLAGCFVSAKDASNLANIKLTGQVA